MPVLNRIAAFADEMSGWRRHLHRHPELAFDCQETSDWIAARLAEFGVDEVHRGIARTGIVALIRGRAAGPVIGLRADMDALPIDEATGVAHASVVAGRMHACGHDGHVTMLLGAAKYLAETRNFAGTVALIFQPAEEDGAGAQVMVREGVLDRFGIAEVYALHNLPDLPSGHFRTAPGPVLAAVDTATVRVTGKGGHGAMPQDCVDPVVAIVAMVQGVQTIVTRNADPMHEVVMSVTQIHAGTASNIVPATGWFCVTIRSFDPATRGLLKRRFFDLVEGTAAAFGVAAEIDYDWGYPPTVNDPGRTAFAAGVAAEVAGEGAVDAAGPRYMWSEDFAYMLEKRPGAYLYIGNGPGAGLHHPAYDFNDEVAPAGASFFARLVERALPVV
ncbi:MAG: M20 aminoacylase family protein [Paracoccaceae bacterium]